MIYNKIIIPWKYSCLSDHFKHGGFTRALVTNNYYSRQMIGSAIGAIVIAKLIQDITVHINQ